MVEVTVVDTTIRAVDRANNEATVETMGWDQPAPELDLPFPMATTTSGRTSRLAL